MTPVAFPGLPELDVLVRRFEWPDETRTFEKGRFELVRVGAMTIGRATYEPGWIWSEHVGPIAGTRLCEVEHLGIVLSGRAKVRMDDGREIDLSPGDLFAIRAGHDSWVVGADPYISLHFLGADSYGVRS